jgi:hypothetical protein
VDKNKAVVCCLLATSAIILSEKKKRKGKMWSKKWYLERNTSCDVHLLNELLETDAEFERLEMMPSRCRKVNAVAYPGTFFFGRGGCQQIQLRTEGRENGDLGGVSPLVRGSSQFANE